MKPHEKRLMLEVPLMKCANKTEFQQRLQWLSEGTLRHHVGDGSGPSDPAEIGAYRKYKILAGKINVEEKFAKRLAKAGWYTYRDEETGRVVTNAYEHEVEKLAKISGTPCEVVSAGWDGGCARVGPQLPQAPNR